MLNRSRLIGFAMHARLQRGFTVRTVRTRRASACAVMVCAALVISWSPIAAQVDIGDLRTKLDQAEGIDRISVLNRLSQAVAMQDPAESIELSEEAVNLARRHGHREGEVDAINNLGNARYFLAEYDLALERYEESLAIAEAIDYSLGIANSLNNLGIIYWIWGEYDQTTDYYLRSLEIRRRLGDEQGIAKALNNLGSVSYAAKSFDTALEYYSESLEIYRRLGDQSLISSSLNNIGLVHFELGEDGTAEDYFSRGLSIAEAIGDPIQQAYSLTHLGMLAERRDDHSTALDHHSRALEVRLATGDRRGEAVCEHNIGVSLSNSGKLDESLIHLERALAIAEGINLKQIIRDTHLALSQVYADNGDFERAIEHHRSYDTINQELFNEERDRRMAELQTRYAVVEKDAEIERLQTEQEKQLVIRNAMIAGSVAMLLIVVLLVNRNRLKTRAHQVIRERNMALERARDEQDRAHRAELTHVGRVATMGELTAAVAHELNQPLTAILTNARAGQRFLGIDPPDLEEVDGALDDVVVGAERTRDLIARLRELIRRGEITRETLDLNGTIRGIESISRSEAQLSGVNLEFDLADDLPPVVGDRVQLQQVVLNLVQNGAAAMRNGDAGDRELRLATSRGENGLVIVAVTDHGPPVEKEILRTMFEPFFTTKADGLGMGLPICHTIIEAHGGELLAVENSTGGLTVSFTIPAKEPSA